MGEWNFSPDVIAKAQEISIGARVAVHWSEAECQDQEGTVVGVNIHRYGKVDYTVHIDGDISPTDGFPHDRSGTKGGTIRLLSPALSLEEEVKRLREALSQILRCEYDGHGLRDCTDRNGTPYKSADLARCIADAEAALKDNGNG